MIIRLLTIFILFGVGVTMFSACEQKPTVRQSHPIVLDTQLNYDIRCDTRGYAYYRVTNDRHTSYTPILQNTETSVKQVLCNELK